MSAATFKQYWLPEKKGFDSLQLRAVPKELPQFGQVLVRIKAVSLNWRDGIVAIGTYPFPGPDALVPGSDGAGKRPLAATPKARHQLMIFKRHRRSGWGGRD